MQLDLRGHPIHTRALTVEITGHDGDREMVTSDLLDLRKRGFTPVGSELQGAGIIHQMGLRMIVDRATRTVERVEARQPVVAFEASAATRGESCRDVVVDLQALVGMRLDGQAAERLREMIGGAAGCSHLLAAAQLLCATLSGFDAPEAARAPAGDLVHRRRLRRDLVIDGAEIEPGRLAIGIQLSDLASSPGSAGAVPRARFAAHDELRLQLELQGWPGVITELSGAARRRTPADFATAAWRDVGELLGPLRGLTLGRGSNRAIVELLADQPPLRAALLQLTPALIQCRASFPDKWLNVATTSEGHPGLIGMPDSCYMWRRGGALERTRGANAPRE